MNSYSLGHLADRTLLLRLAELVSRDRTTTAALLAHLAEVDERRLYAPAGYPSMYQYCVGELRLSEQATYNRILAARTARRFPAIFTEVAEGRLHLSAVVQLASHLTDETADELLAAAVHKSKSEIEHLIADRFPRPDLATEVSAVSSDSAATSVGPALAHGPDECRSTLAAELSPGKVESPADLPSPSRLLPPGPVTGLEARAKLAPLAPQRYALQVTVPQSTHDKLRHVQELLGSAIPSGDVAQVLDRALDALILQLEKRRFGSSAQTRPATVVKDGRYVPAEVKKAVWKRDGGRCTFVSDSGHRCEARKFIEFDHVEPVARGGRSTTANVRLRCRAHNQLAAERALGAEFMRSKREAARPQQLDPRQVAEAEHARAEAAEKARAAAENVRCAIEAHAAGERDARHAGLARYSPRLSSSRNASP
jgi:hypothetical protein